MASRLFLLLRLDFDIFVVFNELHALFFPYGLDMFSIVKAMFSISKEA